MKILKMYIYNYGKFSDYSLDFNSGLNTINNVNGSGKTTISSFIKSMLFGISDNGKSVSTSTRLHYAPWNGNKFGGYLDISNNEKKYRIERVFSPTSSTNDIFNLIDLDTNLKSNDYTSKIGEEILGLNADSFERTLFIPQETQNKKYIDDNGLSIDVKSKILEIIGGNLDASLYDKAIERLNEANRVLFKAKDSKYKEAVASYNETLDKVNNAKSSIAAISQIDFNQDEINKEILILEGRQNELQKISNECYLNASLEGKTNMVESYKKRISNMESEINANKAKLNGVDENTINIKEVNKYIEELNNLKLTNNDNNSLSLELTLLEPYSNIDDSILDNLSTDIKKYKELDSKLNSSFKIYTYISVILSIVLFILGIVLVINKNSIPGIISFVGFIIATIVFFVLFFKRGEIKKEYKIVNTRLNDFFTRYELDGNEYDSYLFSIKENVRKRKAILEKNMDIDLEDSRKKERISALNELINNFFNRFDLKQTSYFDKVIELSNIIKDVNDMTFEYKRLVSEYEKYKKDNKIDDTIVYEKKYDFEKISLEKKEIEEKILKLKTRISDMNASKDKLNEQKALLDDLISECDGYKKEIDDIKYKHKIIETTIDELNKAHTGLLNKFVKPVSSRVSKYLEFFNFDDEYLIDGDFNFVKIYKGSYKDSKFLSKGYQDMVSFIMRIAIIDSLFENKPFILLDDPFVNYDEANLASIKSLVKSLALDYQIIYFTCHSSRNIEEDYK